MNAARGFGLLPALFVALAAAPGARAQIISPGKLSTAHAGLEGMNNCALCHDIGKRGVSDAKCLDCHGPLKARVARKSGLHATFDKPCASCHKEHFGPRFAMLKFDTAGFDHSKTGYQLKLSHRKVTCRDCHQDDYIADTAVAAYAAKHKTADHTFLGLGQTCTTCHHKDDVHGNQFPTRACTDCHTEKTWKEAPGFNHDRTRYVLTGKHRDVKCESCHKPTAFAGMAKPVVRFAGVTFSACTECHRDPHRGVMKQTCESCHATDGWNRLLDKSKFEATFDHTRTKFSLKGVHAKATCDKCHNPRAALSWTTKLTFAANTGATPYPAPSANDCLSCHVDVHEASFARSPGGSACQNCHTENGWLPTTYDLARHSRETYVLTGAHLAVPCADCHKPATAAARVPRFHLGGKDCLSCHASRDPHAGQFTGRACDECHTTTAFTIAAFNHAKTRYPLDGAHQKVPCASCHRKVTEGQVSFIRYRPLETTCRACHGAEIPRGRR